MGCRRERGTYAELRDEVAGTPPAKAQLDLIDLRLGLWATELGRGRMPHERLMLGIDALLDQRLVAMERRDALRAQAGEDVAAAPAPSPDPAGGERVDGARGASGPMGRHADLRGRRRPS